MGTYDIPTPYQLRILSDKYNFVHLPMVRNAHGLRTLAGFMNGPSLGAWLNQVTFVRFTIYG